MEELQLLCAVVDLNSSSHDVILPVDVVDELYSIPQRVQYKLRVTMYRCLQNRAPQYLVDCCVWTSDVTSRQRLRSANRRQLVMPRHRRSQFGRRSFSVSSDGLELVSRLPSGPNAEHRQLQIDIKDSPVRGATGHVAH